MVNYYNLLHINYDATPDQIRRAFRMEAKKVHPDLYHGNDSKERYRLQRQFILLTQAYEL